MEVRMVLEPLDDHDASLVDDEDRDSRVAELFRSGRVVG